MFRTRRVPQGIVELTITDDFTSAFPGGQDRTTAISLRFLPERSAFLNGDLLPAPVPQRKPSALSSAEIDTYATESRCKTYPRIPSLRDIPVFESFLISRTQNRKN
jgi:hypothetical protein